MMSKEDFTVRINYDSISITKGDKSFGIEQSVDNDIWFRSVDENFGMEINCYLGSSIERKTYAIFEKLMKSIVGRYVLTGDYANRFSMLPEDFINLEDKTIIWHSDSSNSTLMLQYSKESIKISIVKGLEDIHSNKVRIRTNGSSYGYYCQEFESFFQEMREFALSMSSPSNNEPVKNEKKFKLMFNKSLK